MRYRLRTLLILMAVVPPSFAAMLFAGIVPALLFSFLIAFVA
jgi:hypothetical protein